MSIKLVHRPGRVTAPVAHPQPEVLKAPPAVAEQASSSIGTQMLMPMMGAITSGVMMVVLRNGQPIFLMVAALMFVGAIGMGAFMAISGRGRATRQRAYQRELYLDYLEQARSRYREENEAARVASLRLSPAPADLPAVVRDPARLWERRSDDADFLKVRIGTADVTWRDLSIEAADNPTAPHDPALEAETNRLIADVDSIPALPVNLPLDKAGQVAIIGTRADTQAVARSIVAQAAALHSPDDLNIAVVFPREQANQWTGVDALPHMVNARLYDGPVPARRVAQSLTALSRVLGPEIVDRAADAAMVRRGGTANRAPRMLVIADGWGSVAGRLALPDASLGLSDLGITVVHLLRNRLDEPEDVSVRVTVQSQVATVERISRGEEENQAIEAVTIDDTSHPLLCSLARELAPLRLTELERSTSEEVSAMSTTDLLGITDLDHLDRSELWAPRAASDFLRVPIGVDDQSQPVLLDLKESAQFGMGPHGICVGATGSGKSEMLRTLVLGLAMSHSPEDLSMILVDYKGGAAFSPFESLPHLAGLMDNLADDAQLTVRARMSIAGEVVRRQQMLKDAGSMASIGHYRERRKTDPSMPPMPHLLLVVDEFGELLTAEPEFTDLFLQIGRIGRSIGVHLLLSSQRIESGKLRGLDTYLSYRLGLRTFSESESQTVLDTGDAFRLPAIPGYGYLKVDTTVYTRFRSGYVSGPVESEAPGAAPDVEVAPPLMLPVYNTIASGGSDLDEPQPQLVAPEVGRTLVQVCVETLTTFADPVTPVWLPPLPARLGLNQVLTRYADTEGPSAVVGLLDDPARQAQSPWVLDLTRSGGHIAILGGPQSGRSTLLRTIASSLALTHTPTEVNIYGLDLTGGGLLRLEGFPHVGGVAIRSNRDRITRLIEELRGMIATRDMVFQKYNLDSMTHLRKLHAEGRIPELPSADIVLLIDGYGAMKTEFDELHDPVSELLGRGASLGLHFVAALGRWNDVRMAQQSEFGTRIELRLNDPTDSQVDRKLSQTIRPDNAGRALTMEKLFAQISLPVPEEVDDSEVGDALEALAERSRESWDGPGAAPIRLLPLELDPSELDDGAQVPDAVPVGLRQDSMDNALWEFNGADQHLLILGDSQSGKSTLLRTIARGLVDRFSSDELVVALMDVRNTVGPAIEDEYLGGHAKSGTDARGLAASIAGEMGRRSTLPPDELAATPRVVVLVDDFDILGAGGADLLDPLLPHLPAARDLRLNVVLARPVSGASRAMYSPILQGMRDTGGSLFLMSGDRAEGQILPRLSAQVLPPGRGLWVRRAKQPYLVQTAMEPVTELPRRGQVA